jgi:YYY domain-containing protein
VIIAGVFTFGAFRVSQPYGFVGTSQLEWQYTLRDCAALNGAQAEICNQTRPMPEAVTKLVVALPEPMRPILAPSARWVAELQNASASASGEIDFVFGFQWANRAPVSFSLTNIVFWGLGIPLGLTAVIGAIFALAQAWRGRRWWAYLVPALWTIGFFLYQGTQYVKSIRYQLPIYPMLCVLAAALLLFVWRRIGGLSVARRALASAPAALVLLGTAVWTGAFMSIYADVMPRVEATRWLYQHAPTALTLRGTSAGVERQFQLPLVDLYLTPGAPIAVQFKLQREADSLNAPLDNLTLQLNRMTGGGDVTTRLIDVATNTPIFERRERLGPTKNAFTLDAAVAVQPERDYRLEFVSTDLINASTSVVADQHWDEGVPTRVDGRDPYGQYFRGLTSFGGGSMEVYNEEDPGKTEQMLNAMDEVDYLILSTNRQYASVARLPWRFPMTNRYYQALMSGELGFELAADFHRFVRVGPYIFNDQEFPHRLRRTENTQGTPPGIEVPYPTAEEAFSVYDHPRVLIFKKTPNYTRENAQAILGVYDLTRTVKRSALAHRNTPGGLLLDPKTLDSQQVSGTWRELYPRNSPLNASQPLAALAWLALFEALGIAGFLLLASITRRADGASALFDGGFAFGKALALVLIAFSGWLIASLKLATFERPLLIALCAVVAAAAAVIGHRNRDHIIALVKSRWPLLLAGELIFLASFGAWLYVRAGNPDLWHPYFGGEKPMDFAYLNSVLKAAYFPPQDPWFAGGYINYYYFGFVVIGWPIKMLGIDPAIAYNLAVPTLFALTALGGFGAASTIYAAIAARRNPELDDASAFDRARVGRAIMAGLIAAVFAVFIGNTKQWDTVVPALTKLGEGSLIAGIGKWFGGDALPIPTHWMYWNATRPTPELPIAEFPHFTFLYADLHAHMIAMPLAFLALAFALAFASGARRWPAIVLGAIAVGALWPANTWDYFPYLALGLAGLIIGRHADAALREASPAANAAERWINAIVAALPALLVFGLLSRAFYQPYHQTFGAGYGQVDPWNGERTPLGTYLAIHGLFALPLLVALLYRLGALGDAGRDDRASVQRWSALALVGGLAVGAFFALRSSANYAGNAEQNGVALTSLLSAPIVLLALVAALRERSPGPLRVLWLMVAGAFALTLFVEHYTLRGDIGRMNTAFKFYIAVWLLLGSGAAAAVVWVLDLIARADRARVALAPASVVLQQDYDGPPATVSDPEKRPARPWLEASDADPIDRAEAQALASAQTIADPADAITSDAAATKAADDVEVTGVIGAATGAMRLPEGTVEVPQPQRQLAVAATEPPRPADIGARLLSTGLPQVAFATLLTLGIVLGALYPAFAIPAKVTDRYVESAPRGLDGMAYMQTAMLQGHDLEAGRQPFPLRGDYDAIRWMQDNVNGSPTIIEAHAGGNQYRWAGRFSIYTGLPSVVGWQWHQRQQRGGELLDERVIIDRFFDVETFYSTQDPAEALKILRRYNVKYIVAGDYERMSFGQQGFFKFAELTARGSLRAVHESGGVTIYEVLSAR